MKEKIRKKSKKEQNVYTYIQYSNSLNVKAKLTVFLYFRFLKMKSIISFLILLIIWDRVLSETLIGFDFPSQNVSNKNIETLKIIPTVTSNSTGLTICLKLKLQFWNMKCIFSSKFITLAMTDYKRGLVR